MTSTKVVMTVTRIFCYVAPPSDLTRIVGPLLRLLHLSKEIERVVLANLLVIMTDHPVRIMRVGVVVDPEADDRNLQSLFAPHYSRFLLRATDLRETKKLKLSILLKLLSLDNYQFLLREFVVCETIVPLYGQ